MNRMDDLCKNCAFAQWDYEAAEGGGYWFVDHCKLDHDIDPVVTECGDFEEVDGFDDN